MRIQTEQIKAGNYFPLTAKFWKNVSSDAKQLLTHMLARDPDERFSVEEILEHPWLSAVSTSNDLAMCTFESQYSEAISDKIENCLDFCSSPGSKRANQDDGSFTSKKIRVNLRCSSNF